MVTFGTYYMKLVLACEGAETLLTVPLIHRHLNFRKGKGENSIL
jgi:hypothetical protein